jgi:hypothetical protein
MNGRLFLWLAISAVCAGVVAGLLAIGGPVQGRSDRFDAKRIEDLRLLVRVLDCQGNSDTAAPLPEVLTVEALQDRCGHGRIASHHLFDDETAKPYSYERTGDRSFRICATFHDAERAERLNPRDLDIARFDPTTGCVSGMMH